MNTFRCVASAFTLLVLLGCASNRYYSFEQTDQHLDRANNCASTDYVCGEWHVTMKGANWDIAIAPVTGDKEYAYHGVLLRMSSMFSMFDVGEVVVKLKEGDRIHEGVELWKNAAGGAASYKKAIFSFPTDSTFVQDNQLLLGWSPIGTEWNGERSNSFR